MSIRSIAAGNYFSFSPPLSLFVLVTHNRLLEGGWLDGVLIPRVGICSIDHPLVAKASAGTTTLPRLNLLHCSENYNWIELLALLQFFVEGLYEALQAFSRSGFELIGLDPRSKTSLFSF